ncbi:hypothetical protein Pelo_3734 [Pelomyxa schiedti]|nr:hypothetical protein Pelo_3734 [Pelomyxa schiedti]
MRAGIIAAIVVVGGVIGVLSATDCTYTTSDGSYYYDLTNITTSPNNCFQITVQGDVFYYVNVCGQTPIVQLEYCLGSSVCHMGEDLPQIYSAGMTDTQQFSDAVNPASGVIVTYKAPEKEITSVIGIECAPTITGPGKIVSVKESGSDYVYFVIKSQWACPIPS